MIKRRDLLKGMLSLPLVGGLFGNAFSKPPINSVSALGRDYFKELGLRSYINAAGTYTSLTGSIMRPEVIDAINYASKQYVRLEDIQERVGVRISELLGCEDAQVTAGAFSAMTLGLAGVLTGMDREKAARIPNDLSGMKSEVILQKSHHIGYAHALRNTGVKIVEVETKKELEKAINKETAMLWYLNAHSENSEIAHEEFIEIGKKNNIPTMNDCAADVPPVENLWKYTDMGYDLVCFSGGKGIKGPQSAGLLLGRKDLIEAARISAPPNGDTVGRGMKVNKEEVLGMLVALETYIALDHEQEWKLWERQIKFISDQAKTVNGVETEIHVPEVANHVPSLKVTWDQSQVGATPFEIREALKNGHPSIETKGGDKTVDITTWMMNPGEERIVAERLRMLLKEASKKT
ncbi:MAG: selenocysteine synthase [Cytophagales bacterium]|nr:selenocysteine synthase [Cytophagales bacterium]